MLQNAKFQRACKALVLIGLGLFLYSRLMNGTLYFYIAQRFAGFTLIAIVGLILVGVSYHFGMVGKGKEDPPDPVDDKHEHQHDHRLQWGGLALLLSPILLGLLVPPQPLGAAALANREINVGNASTLLPGVLRAAQAKSATDKNILDWWHLFQSTPDASQRYSGETGKVIGFTYRDEKFAEDQFFVVRYTMSCCVADSSPIGLVVRWPEAATLPADQWVEVSGVFEPGHYDGKEIPVLVAQTITNVPIPDQPYLYP